MSPLSLHHLPSLHFVFLWNNTIVVVTSASLLCSSQWDGLIICLFACLLACLLTLPLDTAILFTEEILESSSHLGMCLAYYNSSSRGTYIHIRTPRTMALPMRDSLNSQSTVSQQSVIQSPQTQLFDSSPCAYRSQLNVNKSPGYLGKNELNHFS